MGFSVSGSAAIVFAGMFIALGMLQPAVSNGLEEVTEARSASADRLLDQQNTEIEIRNAEHNTSNGTVVARVDNTGTTALSVDDTDFVLNNTYESVEPSASTVDGNGDTTAWLPGETLRVELDDGEYGSGDRLVVAVDHGVSDATANVTEVSN